MFFTARRLPKRAMGSRGIRAMCRTSAGRRNARLPRGSGLAAVKGLNSYAPIGAMMTTDKNNDGLEIPAHLKRARKVQTVADKLAKPDAANIDGAAPGASQVLADE